MRRQYSENQEKAFYQQNELKKQSISLQVLIKCLFIQINKVRQNPRTLLIDLKTRLSSFNQTKPEIYYPFYPQKQFSIKTHSGKSGVQDLINFIQKQALSHLDNTSILKNLLWSDFLHQAAMERAQSFQNNHTDIQQMEIGELVAQYAHCSPHLSEIIIYGFVDPKLILIEALIDDYSTIKKKRLQIFDKIHKYVGIGFAKHPTYKIVSIIILASTVEKAIQHILLKSSSYSQECNCNPF